MDCPIKSIDCIILFVVNAIISRICGGSLCSLQQSVTVKEWERGGHENFMSPQQP